MEKVLIVLSGCPASGKSTFINELRNAIKCDVVQIDSILNEFKVFSPEIYHYARESLFQTTEDTLLLLLTENNRLLL